METKVSNTKNKVKMSQRRKDSKRYGQGKNAKRQKERDLMSRGHRQERVTEWVKIQ